MSHEQIWPHKTHHSLDLGETTTFPLIVYFVPNHGTNTQMSFCQDFQMGVPKFPKLWLLQLWRPITLCAKLWLRWNLKKSCSPCQELSNSMWHTTYTQGNQDDSWLLVVGSQIGNLTFGLFSGHNLCFKSSNGSCEPILNICIPRTFQWYKELLNPMSFDPYNYFLKIQESIRTPIPKVGAHLTMWGFIPSHFLTLLGTWNVTPGLQSWPVPLLALLWSRAQG